MRSATSPRETAPEGWRPARLRDVVSFRNGADFAHVEAEEPGYPVYGSGGRFRWASAWLHDGPSVLFGRKGTIDRPIYVTGRFWTVDTMYYTVPNQRLISPKFLYYWATRLPFDYYSTGTALPSMTQSDLGSEPLLLPSIEVQQQIADYLDHETAEIDAFIADLRRLRELESERINAEVDISFRAFSDHLVPLKRLGLARESGVSVNGVAWPATGSEPGVLRTGSVSKGYFDPAENKAVLEPEERERLATPVLADSLIVNRANTPDLVGRGVYVRHAHPNLYLSDLLWRVQVGGGCTEYVGAWMASRAYAESIARIRVGASATMQKISFESFSRIGVPLPNERSRREVAIRVDELRRGRARFEADIDAAIALAKERRAALITAAVTGQIDVTSRQKPVVDSIQTAIEEAR